MQRRALHLFSRLSVSSVWIPLTNTQAGLSCVVASTYTRSAYLSVCVSPIRWWETPVLTVGRQSNAIMFRAQMFLCDRILFVFGGTIIRLPCRSHPIGMNSWNILAFLWSRMMIPFSVMFFLPHRLVGPNIWANFDYLLLYPLGNVTLNG